MPAGCGSAHQSAPPRFTRQTQEISRRTVWLIHLIHCAVESRQVISGSTACLSAELLTGFLNAKPSHCIPVITCVSAVSHKCRLANTNPPANNASAIGMHVKSGGLAGWRSIGMRVKQKKILPAESVRSCQRLFSARNSNWSSVGIFAILAVMKRDFPAIGG